MALGKQSPRPFRRGIRQIGEYIQIGWRLLTVVPALGRAHPQAARISSGLVPLSDVASSHAPWARAEVTPPGFGYYLIPKTRLCAETMPHGPPRPTKAPPEPTTGPSSMCLASEVDRR